MKFTTLLSVSAMAMSALGQSIHIPVDLPDGAYLIGIDDDGNQIVTELGDITSTDIDSVANNTLGKRAFDWPSGTYHVCPGGSFLGESDFYNRVFDEFWNLCFSHRDKKAEPGKHLVTTAGSAVAYMCAFTKNPCSTNEFGNAVDRLAKDCKARKNGEMEPAYLHIPAWNKRYGYAQKDTRVC